MKVLVLEKKGKHNGTFIFSFSIINNNNFNMGREVMGGGFNTWTKYFHDFVIKIKSRKSKEDTKKLKDLESKSKKLEKQKDIAFAAYYKLINKFDKVEESIERINNKYSYKVKTKTLNPHYRGDTITI